MKNKDNFVKQWQHGYYLRHSCRSVHVVLINCVGLPSPSQPTTTTRVIHVACDDCTSSWQKQVKILSCALKVNFKKFKKDQNYAELLSLFLIPVTNRKIRHMHNKKHYYSKVLKPLKMAFP